MFMYIGALDGGGPKCGILILRNAHVPCHYFCNVHIDLKKCRTSNLRHTFVIVFIFIHLSLGSVSHVDFEKWPCRVVEFKGQEPSGCHADWPFDQGRCVWCIVVPTNDYIGLSYY